jgi:hypothetical protein
LSQKAELLISADALKKSLIYLRVNYHNLSGKELEKWLNEHVSKVIYLSETEAKIYFKLLDVLVG